MSTWVEKMRYNVVIRPCKTGSTLDLPKGSKILGCEVVRYKYIKPEEEYVTITYLVPMKE